MSQPPMISGYDDCATALDEIVEQLALYSGRADFVYNDMCAISVHVTRHLAGAFALTVGYTNRERQTRIWWPGGDNPRSVARAMRLWPGHDTDTLGRLLGDLGERLIDRRLAPVHDRGRAAATGREQPHG